jgi:3-isopropylmalate dehydratase small subunit
LTDPTELAQHALSGIDPSFSEKAQQGMILVVGHNFGCGSSREQAVTCLKYAGVKAIIASSVARIFFRNAINQGLLVLHSPKTPLQCKNGDMIGIDTEKNILNNISRKKTHTMQPLPPFVIDIVETGGLLLWLKKKKKMFD